MEHLSLRELFEGKLVGSSFTGDLEDCVELVSGDGHLSSFGSRLETW